MEYKLETTRSEQDESSPEGVGFGRLFSQVDGKWIAGNFVGRAVRIMERGSAFLTHDETNSI